MAEITAKMIKDLRESTGAGMVDCKKALQEANGDMDAAIELMRKSGAIKAAKKSSNIAAEGIIVTAAKDGYVSLVEINSQTDFAAKNETFDEFAKKVAEIAVAEKIEDVEELKKCKYSDSETVDEALVALIAKIGENIQVRRVKIVTGSVIGTYIHTNKRIGVIVTLEGGNEDLAKQVALHVCANKPDFLNPSDVSAEVVEKERQIQIDIAMQSGKPKEIAEKMVEGRIKKFTGEVSLTGQDFVMDPSVTVGDMLKSKGAVATGFTRFEVGEGIEKKESNFAEEVQAQIQAASK